MTYWHESFTNDKSADPVKDVGTSPKKMLAEMESPIANCGYDLKTVTECKGQIFVFLINKSELKRYKIVSS
jgi:hypothetical protein